LSALVVSNTTFESENESIHQTDMLPEVTPTRIHGEEKCGRHVLPGWQLTRVVDIRQSHHT
jgi:hypothetical protein